VWQGGSIVISTSLLPEPFASQLPPLPCTPIAPWVRCEDLATRRMQAL
jgi:hypothetical protein